jgi:hypothetical protein
MKTIWIVLFTLLCCSMASAQTLKDCASCVSKTLQPEDIKTLSIDEIRFLTNDLFARRGYKFKSGEVDSYYSQIAWYKPKKNNSEVIFNDIEKQNTKLFQDRTVYLKSEREKVLTELKALKVAVLANNQQELGSRFKYPKSTPDFQYLQKALEKVSIDDIHWFKHDTKFEMTIDDGDFIRVYSIDIKGNQIQIKYNNQGGSHLATSTTLYPTDYNNEFAYWWIFEFNGSMKFIKFDAAG